MRKWISLFESEQPDFDWLDDWYANGSEWSELFAGVDTSTYELPVGTDLYHGTEGGWSKDQIRMPAWFGDHDMAINYASNVFNHDNPDVYHYVTTAPYRLLVLQGEIQSRLLALMDGGDIIMSDLALAVIEDGGFDGWYEPGGEIMLGSAKGLRAEDDTVNENVEVRRNQATLKDGRAITLTHEMSDGGEVYDEDEGRPYEPYVAVTAYLGDRAIGHCLFDPEEGMVRGVETKEDYRRLGVATAIYDYLEALGYYVQPSYNQEPDGEAFWKARSHK